VTKPSPPQSDERSDTTTTVTLDSLQPPTWLTKSSNDPARALVVDVLRALVDSGEAGWTLLESGDVRITCLSGMVLHLGEDGVTRIE
jgi:hypothetical protein